MDAYGAFVGIQFFYFLAVLLAVIGIAGWWKYSVRNTTKIEDADAEIDLKIIAVEDSLLNRLMARKEISLERKLTEMENRKKLREKIWEDIAKEYEEGEKSPKSSK